jgi:hypothetical protein
MDVLAASFVLLMDARILAAPEPRARGGDRDVLVVGEPTADLPITDSAAAAMVSPVLRCSGASTAKGGRES